MQSQEVRGVSFQNEAQYKSPCKTEHIISMLSNKHYFVLNNRFSTIACNIIRLFEGSELQYKSMPIAN